MVAPINYRLDVQSPFESTLQGVQLGAGIADIRAKQQAAELQAKQATELKTDLAALNANPAPSAQDYAKMMTKYPQLSEQLKRGWDVMEEGQRQSRLADGTKVYAALESNRPDIAQQLLADQAEAYRNAGDEAYAQQLDSASKMIDASPDMAKRSVGLLLSSVMGPEKFVEAFAGLGKEMRAQALAPAQTVEAEAKASRAAVEAQFAESNAIADLTKKGWDTSKVASDIEISKINTQIAAMNAGLKKEENELRRQELQERIQKMKDEREAKVREKTASLESARGQIDNMINTIDRLLKNPELSDVLGSVEGRLPPVSDMEADAVALIETLQSQAFMAQIPQMTGMGALSNAEGEKITASIQNLSRVQSEPQFIENLNEIQRLMLKGRKNLAKKFGLPDTAPDTPEVTTESGEIDALIEKYGGQ